MPGDLPRRWATARQRGRRRRARDHAGCGPAQRRDARQRGSAADVRADRNRSREPAYRKPLAQAPAAWCGRSATRRGRAARQRSPHRNTWTCCSSLRLAAAVPERIRRARRHEPRRACCCAGAGRYGVGLRACDGRRAPRTTAAQAHEGRVAVPGSRFRVPGWVPGFHVPGWFQVLVPEFLACSFMNRLRTRNLEPTWTLDPGNLRGTSEPGTRNRIPQVSNAPLALCHSTRFP